MFAPVAILVGVLAAGVLGGDRPAAGTPRVALGGVPATAPAPAPLPDRHAAPLGPPPPAAAPPAAAPGPPPPVVAPPATTPAPPPAPPSHAPIGGYTPPGTERLDVGIGPQGAAIFRGPASTGETRPGSVVIFLHGWVAIDPARYGPWIAHLVRSGATVIYPAYQSKPTYDTITPLANVLAGVRAALAHVQLAPGRLVVAGHSTGGALAADYAAAATVNGLPAPAAVFSVYPGRKLHHLPVPIPAVDPSLVAPGTRVLAYAGERDTAVGSGTAERIVAGAAQAHATLRIIRDDAVDDHSAPRRFDGAAQRTFWAPLDQLVAATARPQATPSASSARLRAAVAP